MRKTGAKKKTGEKQEAGKMKSKKQESPVKNRRLDGYVHVTLIRCSLGSPWYLTAVNNGGD